MIMRQKSAAARIATLFIGYNLLAASCLTYAEPRIKLSSKLIEVLDGIILNGHRIRLTHKLKRELARMLIGAKSASGQIEGFYSYHGGKHTINDLTEIEERAAHAYEQEHKELQVTGNHEAIKALELEYAKVRKELADTLEAAKSDFDVKVEGFMKHAAGMKGFIFKLIEDSCAQRKLPNSFLLTWGQAEEGEKEREIFHTQIRSFRQLREFLRDLNNFLGDLINSCPKGEAQFKEMKQKYEEDKKHQAAGARKE